MNGALVSDNGEVGYEAGIVDPEVEGTEHEDGHSEHPEGEQPGHFVVDVKVGIQGSVGLSTIERTDSDPQLPLRNLQKKLKIFTI